MDGGLPALGRRVSLFPGCPLEGAQGLDTGSIPSAGLTGPSPGHREPPVLGPTGPWAELANRQLLGHPRPGLRRWCAPQDPTPQQLAVRAPPQVSSTAPPHCPHRATRPGPLPTP